MKSVYKCDYCNFISTEEEVKDHEINCIENYDRKNCYTCKHRSAINVCSNVVKYECKNGMNIPLGKIYEFCDHYERKEINKYRCVDNFFNNLFGW